MNLVNLISGLVTYNSKLDTSHILSKWKHYRFFFIPHIVFHSIYAIICMYFVLKKIEN